MKWIILSFQNVSSVYEMCIYMYVCLIEKDCIFILLFQPNAPFSGTFSDHNLISELCLIYREIQETLVVNTCLLQNNCTWTPGWLSG